MWAVRPQHYYLRQCKCKSLFPIVFVCLNKSETFAKISKTSLFSKCAPMETWHVEVVEHRRNCQLVKWVTEWISEWLGNYIIEDNPLHYAEVVILILEHSWIFNNYIIIKFETLKIYSRNLLEKSEEGDWTQTISKGCSHLLSCSQKMNFLSSCHHLVNLLACLVSRWFFWDFTVNQSNGYTHNTKVWFWPSPMTEFEASKNLLCI